MKRLSALFLICAFSLIRGLAQPQTPSIFYCQSRAAVQALPVVKDAAVAIVTTLPIAGTASGMEIYQWYGQNTSGTDGSNVLSSTFLSSGRWLRVLSGSNNPVTSSTGSGMGVSGTAVTNFNSSFAANGVNVGLSSTLVTTNAQTIYTPVALGSGTAFVVDPLYRRYTATASGNYTISLGTNSAVVGDSIEIAVYDSAGSKTWSLGSGGTGGAAFASAAQEGYTGTNSATAGTNIIFLLYDAVGVWHVSQNTAQIPVALIGDGSPTGTGAKMVLQNGPTLIAPVLGTATATTINKVTLTAPATGSTLTIADGKTLTANNSVTLAGTDATTMTLPSVSSSLAPLASPTFTGTPAAPTTSANDNTTQIATTAFVRAAVLSSYATLTDGATITWTMVAGSQAQHATVTLGGNRTLAFSGTASGMEGTLIVKQDGTGSRTLTLPATSKVISGGAGAVTLTTTASAVDILSWSYDGSNIYWTIGKNFN